MYKKGKHVISILLIIILAITIILSGCSIRKRVRTKEIKEFTKKLLESNDKIVSLKFEFIRPSLYADVLYEIDLEKEDFQHLKDSFKTLIDVDFMRKIGDKYWDGIRPSHFILKVNVEKEDKDNIEYEIHSNYNKTKVSNEDPDNIDGYETWYIEDEDGNRTILD